MECKYNLDLKNSIRKDFKIFYNTYNTLYSNIKEMIK